MPTYKVTSPDGQVLSLTGDAPPTEADLDEVFSTHARIQHLAALKATPDLPVKSTLGQLGEAFDTPPQFVQDYQPTSQLGRIAKAADMMLYKPSTIAMALPFGAALKTASVVGKTVPLLGDAIRAATLAPMAAQGLQTAAESAGQVSGSVAGGTPISDPSQAEPIAGGLLGLTMATPLAESGYVKPEQLPVPEFLKAQPQRPLSVDEINARVATLTHNKPAVSPAGKIVVPSVLTPVSTPQSSLTKKENPSVLPTEPIPPSPASPAVGVIPSTAANLENLSPADRAKSDAANSPLNPGWGDLAPKQPKPVTWVPAIRLGEEVIPVNEHGQGWALKQKELIETAKKAGLSTPEALQASDVAMQKAERGFQGSDGKFYNLMEVARKQLEQTKGTQNEQAGIQTPQQQNAVGGTQEEQGRTVEGSQGETQSQVSGNDGGGLGQARGGDKPGVQGLPTGGEGVVGSKVQELNPTAGQPATYPLSTSVHEGKLVDSEGRTVDPNTRRTTGESGFVIIPKDLLQRLSFKGSTKVDPTQMWNRIKNVLGEDSEAWRYIQAAGLGQFLSQPRSAQELKQWGDEHGQAAVQVHSYGMEGKVSEAKKEYDRMTHEWYDNLSTRERNAVDTYHRMHNNDVTINEDYLNHYLGTANKDNALKYVELKTKYEAEPKDTSPRATSAYSHVSAFDTTQPMPEWTTSRKAELAAGKQKITYEQWLAQTASRDNEISRNAYQRGMQHENELNYKPHGNNVQRVDVVIPGQKALQDKLAAKYGADWSGKDLTPEESKQWKESADKWKPDNLHENLPNTPYWNMIQYVTGPKGERIALIAEGQGSWIQAKHAYESALKKGKTEQEAYEASVHAGSGRGYRPNQNHPLLQHAQRLGMKAAIEQARKEGATHIVVSDAETAMMTEMHDQYTSHPDDLGEGVGYDESAITQAPGMRLNYDTILPKIAEELTGSKGERVSLGEHKNAMVRPTSPTGGAEGTRIVNATPEEIASVRRPGFGYRTEGNDIIVNGSPSLVAHNTGIAEVRLRPNEGVTTPRPNLIFKNADGTPKTDVSGRMYRIGEKNPSPEFSLHGKDRGEGGWVLGVQPIIDAIKDKLAKNYNPDIIREVLGSDAIKAVYLRQAGHDVPKTLIKSPKAADALVRYATADTAGHAIGRSMMTDVLGKHDKNEQFRKQLGGLIYEDMRQAAGGIGNSVLALKNSPFSSQAMYDAAKANPEYQAAIQRWKDTVQKLAEEQHVKLGGTLAATGKDTGAFANLIAVMEDPTYEGNGMSRGNPLATLKKGSAFSKERKFSAEEYNLDARDMGERMVHRNYAEVQKQTLYKTLQDEGLGRVLDVGEHLPDNFVGIPITRRVITILKPGDPARTTNVSKTLAVDRSIYPEIKQAFQTDGPLQNSAGRLLGSIATHIQVALAIDFGVHAVNDITALDQAARQTVGQSIFGVREIDTIKRLKNSVSQVLADDPAIQKEIAKMASQGVSFRGSNGGWSSRALSVIDLATRLSLNRLFDEGVASGAFKDTGDARRRFVSGQAGQYNQRLMTHFQQRMMESGLGPFNVAGRNFNRLTVRRLFLSPSAEATSAGEAVKIRALLALGLATSVVVTPYIANLALTGSPTGRDGTKFGQIDLGPRFDKANGNHTVLDMAQITGLRRAARVTGLGKLYDEQIEPRLQGGQPASMRQTLVDAGKDIGMSAVSPYTGPVVNLASTLATGKTVAGFEQRSPGEQGPPYIGAAISSLNPLAGPATGLGAEGSKDTSTLARIGQKVGSIVGIKESTSPRGVVTNLRRQFLYKLGKANQADYPPSEYDPLKMALASGDVTTAKAAYEKLLESLTAKNANSPDPVGAARKDMQQYFKTYANSHGQASVEDEAVFVKTLTPHQADLYAKAMAQQKAVSDLFFNQIQPMQGRSPLALPKLGVGRLQKPSLR